MWHPLAVGDLPRERREGSILAVERDQAALGAGAMQRQRQERLDDLAGRLLACDPERGLGQDAHRSGAMVAGDTSVRIVCSVEDGSETSPAPPAPGGPTITRQCATLIASPGAIVSGATTSWPLR